MNACMNKVTLIALILWPALGWSAAFYVHETIAEPGIALEDARAATNLIKSSVAARSSDTLIDDDYRADYNLQPRLMRLGDSTILTIEKMRANEVLYTAQVKVDRIDQLDRAARNATFAAIDEPSLAQRRSGTIVETRPETGPPVTIYTGPYTSGETARSVSRGVNVLPMERKVAYWTVGVGPFIPRRLDSESLMYGFMGGRIWDINPRFSAKAIIEANFSSGAEKARLFNFATGGSYFFDSARATSPYATVDIGYGLADTDDESAEGFSFGTGAGIQFFRDTETTLDLLVRYAVVLNSVNGEGDPSVIGLRMAVNF